MLVQVYEREAVSRKCVYEWFKRFREGKETTEDEPRSGRLPTSRTPEMIEKVRQVLAQDRRLTLRLIAEESGFSNNTTHTIVRDDLRERKIFSRFVAHKLTDEQKTKRVEISGEFIFMCDQDPLLLENIVTGNEDLVLQVRSGIKTAFDGLVFTDFLATKKKSYRKIQGQNTVYSILRQGHHL